jgi:hypothetical protein
VSHGDRWDHVDNSDPTLAMLGCGYATCSTAADTADKATGAITGFVRTVGGRVSVLMSNGNTAEDPTLDVSGTGAAAIRCYGAAPRADMLAPGTVYDYGWDGAYWQLLNPSPSPSQEVITLAAANWTGSAAPYTYVVSPSTVRITPTSQQAITLATLDKAIEDAAADADIAVDQSAQAAGSITLVARGALPTVAIPLLIISQTDMRGTGA